MEHSSLVAFLNGDLSPDAFGREISNEVNACEHGFKTEGMGYIMVPDGPTQVITRDHARRLLEERCFRTNWLFSRLTTPQIA